MCGIWAIFGSEVDVTQQCKSCMNIRHRGPGKMKLNNIYLFYYLLFFVGFRGILNKSLIYNDCKINVSRGSR